jgi:hypothetical protein
MPGRSIAGNALPFGFWMMVLPWVVIAPILVWWLKRGLLPDWIQPYLPMLQIGIWTIGILSFLIALFGACWGFFFREDSETRRF